MGQQTFELTAAEAEAYEATFVPGFFAQWVPFLLDAVQVRPGDRVLDVACGTGVVTREALRRVGRAGSVVGLDLHVAMLDVARRVVPGVEWAHGDVAALPFPDADFDRVVCQMAMMFFPNPTAALAEMRRTVRPGGFVAVLVPGALSDNPPYELFVDVVSRHAGAEARQLVSTYFALGDLDALRSSFGAAGLDVTATSRPMGWNRDRSIDSAIEAEIDATPLGGWLSAAARQSIISDCRRRLAPWQTAEGLEFPFCCNLVVGQRELG